MRLRSWSIRVCRRATGSHVKIRGFKVFPDAVPRRLARHPAVSAAWCASGAPTLRAAGVRAAARPSDNNERGRASRRAATLAYGRLPQYMVPAVFPGVRAGSPPWRARQSDFLLLRPARRQVPADSRPHRCQQRRQGRTCPARARKSSRRSSHWASARPRATRPRPTRCAAAALARPTRCRGMERGARTSCRLRA